MGTCSRTFTKWIPLKHTFHNFVSIQLWTRCFVSGSYKHFLKIVISNCNLKFWTVLLNIKHFLKYFILLRLIRYQYILQLHILFKNQERAD